MGPDGEGSEGDEEDLDEVDRLRAEVDDFAARLRVAGIGLVVFGIAICAYLVAAHIIR